MQEILPEPCFDVRSSSEAKELCEKLRQKMQIDGVSAHNNVDSLVESTQYPFRSDPLLLVDVEKGDKQFMRIYSDNGQSISFKFTDRADRLNGKVIEVLADSIIGWNTSSSRQSESSSAVSTAVVGALFFPPLMLIAPFMNRNYESHAYLLSYINSQGRAKKLVITENPIEWQNHKKLTAFLRAISGLPAGQEKNEKAQVAIKKTRLIEMEALLSGYGDKLKMRSRTKPWCLFIDPKVDSSSSYEYEKTLIEVVALRAELKEPDSFVDPKVDQEKEWQNYIAENPRIRAWANSNLVAAKTYKLCGENK